ncbi:MAG: pseudouridine synthase [Verrucomicrobiota bacterium]|nr:pseudouridine synthase [Verrucomicrobiota bacterium]
MSSRASAIGGSFLSSMSETNSFISFPERYLGERPIKFPLLVDDPGYFAINKPAGLACFQHDWNQGKPDISMALRRELLNEKPQLSNLGIEGLFRAYKLDAELSGVLLYAKTPGWEEILKNAAGSSQLTYRFHLLASSDGQEQSFDGDWPIAFHTNGKRMVVSHRTGKKCLTRFRFLRAHGSYGLWEAETRDLRPHQIRVHAAELGLKIAGENLYARGDRIYLSRIKRDYRPGGQEESPIYEGLCLHLISVEFDIPENELLPIQAPLPKGFHTLLKALDRHGRRSRR